MKILCLCLAIAVIVLLIVPPVPARTEEPLFNVQWTPDGCAPDSALGASLCLNLYLQMESISNVAVGRADLICNGHNTESECWKSSYWGWMSEAGAYWSNEWTNTGEMESWILEMYNNKIREFIPWEDPNCAC